MRGKVKAVVLGAVVSAAAVVSAGAAVAGAALAGAALLLVFLSDPQATRSNAPTAAAAMNRRAMYSPLCG